MLKEALDRLLQLCRDTQRTELIHFPGDPAHETYFRTPGHDDLELHVGDAPPRRLLVTRLDDLLALVRRHFDASIKPERAVITYGLSEVRYTWDCTQGQEWAAYQVLPSREMAWFAERAKQPGIAVPDLRLALRTLLSGTIRDNPGLVEQVSRLSTVASVDAAADVGRGVASFGKAVREAVSDPGAMPEPDQVFQVRFFDNPDQPARHPLSCLLDPLPKECRWYLRPIDDSWLAWHEAALRYLRHQIDAGLGLTRPHTDGEKPAAQGPRVIEGYWYGWPVEYTIDFEPPKPH